MGMILAKNVSKIYETGSKKTYALSDVSFEIDKGEFVVILGQSGAGKSTLLNILGGIDSLSTGEVIVNDSPLSKMKENELAEYRAKEIAKRIIRIILLLVSLLSTSSATVVAGFLNTLIIVFQTFLKVFTIASPLTVVPLFCVSTSLQEHTSLSFNSFPHLVQNLFSTYKYNRQIRL